MKTSSFEVQFIIQLSDYIARNYPDLLLNIPHSSRQPDIVIENPRMRRALWIEVKGGDTGNSLPAATISILIEMNASMREQYRQLEHSEFCLITSAQVRPPWNEILAAEHIRVISTGTVEQALMKLDHPLSVLASGK